MEEDLVQGLRHIVPLRSRNFFRYASACLILFVLASPLEAIAQVGQISLDAPPNGAVNQLLAPVLVWNPDAVANYYRVQVSVDSFATFRVDTIVAKSGQLKESLQIGPLGNDTIYYWHVNGRTTAIGGTVGTWSSVWNFRTLPPQPLAPTLFSPPTGSTSLPLVDTLRWNAVATADSYRVQIATAASFASIMKDTVVARDPSQQVQFLVAGSFANSVTYYWRVYSRNASGDSKTPSTAWSFTTIVAAPGVPILASPAAGAASLDTTSLICSWGTVAGATSYRFQLAVDSTSVSILDDSTLSTTSKTIAPIPGSNSRFYWRVRAKNVGGIGAFSSWRSFTTALRQPLIVGPSLGAQNQSTSLGLDWTAVPGGATYWIQFSTSASFATRIVDTTLAGSPLTVSGLLNNTTYSWRVRARAASGDTSKFPPTVWNFKTIVAIPSTPSLILPANGAVSQSLTSLGLSWTAATDAAAYRLQIATDSTFASGMAISDSTLTTTTKSLTSGLASNTKYYWHVQAKNIAGTGSYSSTRSFTTTLAQPTIVAPAMNAVNQPLALLLDWNPSPGSTQSRVQLSSSSTFSTSLLDQTMAADSVSVGSLMNNIAYYWRVSARNDNGDTSAFPTTPWSFKTIVAAPSTPVLASPGQNLSSMPLSGLLLSWVSVPDAATYLAQVATDSLFSSLVVNDSTITSPTRLVGGLANGTRYYWRVCATNIAGTSSFSAVRTFTTLLVPPAISAPASGTVNLPVSLTVDWLPNPQAVSYRVQVSTASTFSPLFLNTVIAADSLPVSGLSYNTKYYWRVNAADVLGDTSAYPGTPWNFTTTLAAPLLVTPVNGASNLSLSPVLSWTKPSGADSCRVQVSVDSSFPGGLNYDMWTTGASLSVGPLEPSQRFYWRVMARGQGGASVSQYSEVRFFLTNVDTPATPVLLSPGNVSVGQPVLLSLTWRSATGAATYSVQLAKYPDSLFSSSLIDGSFQAGTTRSLPRLTNFSKYYWRVRGMNATGMAIGAYSPTWNFTTIIDTPGVPIPAVPVMAAANQPNALTLKWHPASSAYSYKLEVSRNSSMTPIDTTIGGITDTTAAIGPLALSTQYFWRVKGTNSLGDGSFSPIWNFTTTIDVPVLLSPPNDTTGQQTDNLLLTWKPVQGAARYRLRVSVDSLFVTTLVDDSSLVSMSKTLNGLSISTKYFWKMQATNATNAVSTSAVWHFTTIVIVPAVPVLQYPADSAQNAPLSLSPVWGSAIGAAKYRLQVARDIGFATIVYEDSSAGTTLPVPGLAYGTLYYWRVQARNATGPSAFSPVRQFTTIVAAPLSPSLTSPVNGSSDNSNTPVLSWTSIPGSIRYRLQIATLSDFTSLVLDDSTITGTTRSVGPLAHSMTHYWRVAAVNAGGTSPASVTWSFTTIIDTPATVQLALPLNGGVNLPSAEVLRWNVAARASVYHIQLSTDIAFGTTLVDDSTVTSTSLSAGPFAQIPGMTQFYWRARAKNTAGWGSFSPVWNYRTLISTPVTAQPLNGAAGVATSPVTSWHPVSGAGRYRIQISLNSAFSPFFQEDTTITDTSKTFGQVSGSTLFYWRVGAQNMDGSSVSPFSATQSFTTAPDTPAVVTLASPPAGSINSSTTPTFSWRRTPIASMYRLQIAADSLFGRIVFEDSTVADTTRKSSLLAGLTTYYWRVRGQNGTAFGPYSLYRQFTTTIATPVLSSPVDGTQQLPLTVILRWIAADSAATYRVQLSLDSLFATTILDDSTTSVNFRSVGPLINLTQYFWRVRARSKYNNLGAYSTPWRFTTVLQAPPTVVPVGPPSATFNQPSPLILRWKTAIRADIYRVQVSDNPLFTNIVQDDSTLTDTTRSFSPPQPLGWYFWRVRASNAGGTSAYSAGWSFKSAALVPVLSSPANNIVDQPITLTLRWNSSPRAYRYRFQLSLDSMFATRVIDDSLLTVTSRQVGPLINSQTYYWRVATLDTQSVSRSSFAESWSFSTIIATPLTPQIVTPVANAVDQPLAITLKWKRSLLADFYRLQAATDSLFLNKIKDDSTIVDTTSDLASLNPMVRYYWRVRATNHGGSSAYSATSVFTTSIATPVAVAPTDGSIDLARIVAFRWSAVTGVKSYRLQASTDSLFQSTSFDDSAVTTTTRTVGVFMNSTSYYWRVRAKNADGTSVSPYSLPWKFTTIIDTPSTPVLSGPSDNVINNSTAPLFRWKKSTLAVSYDLVVSTDSLFRTTAFRDSLVLDTVRQSPVLPALTKYWWKVRGRDYAGYGSYSPPYRLTTMIATPQPTSPPDSALEQPIAISLIWQPIPLATTYRFQLATDSLFTALVIDDSTLASSRRDVSGLITYTRYYWRVRAINPKSTGEYSEPSLFKTLLVLAAAPSLVSPASGAQALLVQHTLRWHPVRLAERYHVQVSTDTPFLTTVVDDSTCTDSLREAGPLSNLTKYYWRVRALNGKGAGAFSPVWSYTTIIAAPTEPVLVSPPSASRDQVVTLTLRWLAAPRAQTYRVQVSSDVSFGTTVVDDSTVTDTMKAVGPLDNSKTYYWRVAARNTGWSTGFSPVWNYTTVDPPTVYALMQNYPNPFNPTTRISFEVPSETEVTLTVYNILGQAVRVLLSGEMKKTGRYVVEFDAKGLGAGAYFYRIKAGSFVSTKKLMLLK